MELWGYGLYQNEMSQDMKKEFERLFNQCRNVYEITCILEDKYQNVIGEPEEALFWLLLADMQWGYGVLMPVIREKALFWIDRCEHLVNDSTFCVADNEQWEITLEKLRLKLLSPQPPLRKPQKKRTYRCQWKTGDVFAYKIESDLSREKGFYGNYILIQKVDEDIWYPGHIVPIVYVKITRDEKIPSNVEEYNQLEYVQIAYSKYEERFFPIDMRHPREDMLLKSKINYEVDEYGLLPRYRVILLNTSKKVIPDNLIYVGNFVDAIRPQKEYVPHVKENNWCVAWKKFGRTFEDSIIEWYCGNNLREYSVYHETQ